MFISGDMVAVMFLTLLALLCPMIFCLSVTVSYFGFIATSVQSTGRICLGEMATIRKDAGMVCESVSRWQALAVLRSWFE